MAETITYKKRSRFLGILCTSVLAGGILLILLLIILRTPIPPFPEGGGGVGDGIELNLGFTDAGMGNNPQEISIAPEPTPAASEKVRDDNQVMTQDVEDAPSITEKPVNKPKKEVKKTVPLTQTPKKEVKPVPEKQPVVNAKALYTRKSNTSSDGNKNVSGDQGNPSGTLASKAFGGKSGQGGSGGGTGGGNGTGTGPTTGGGISFNLAGRNPQSLPQPEYKQQVEGTVVVEVTVDKEGRVTQAVAGVKGSTTLDDALLEAARKAASLARFDRKPDAPAFQKGTITYRFRLQ